MLIRIGDVLINPAAVAWCERTASGDVHLHMSAATLERVEASAFGSGTGTVLQSHATLTFAAGEDAERLFAELAAAR